MDNEAKIRPFYLAKILYERTDYDHFLTTAQLIEILEKEYNVHAHRITIASDIDLLKSVGMDIQLVKSSQNQYNVLGRYFDDVELKLMIDAIESSRFISTEKSENLVNKIGALAGKNAAETLKRHISVERRIKSDNEKVLSIADAINMAINTGKQISFQYFEYNVKKERKPRFDGYWYKFSPYRLVWNGDYYYVVGWYEKYKRIMSYRVDQIVATPKILEDEEIIPMPKDFDLDHYLNTMYHMFSTERRKVELICSNDVMDAIIDRFGEDVPTYAFDMENFKAEVEIAVNKIFFTWVFGFEGKVIIKGPQDVCDQYKKMIASATETINAD